MDIPKLSFKTLAACVSPHSALQLLRQWQRFASSSSSSSFLLLHTKEPANT
jgi:hypothetical protein